jgi:MFS family permease
MMRFNRRISVPSYEALLLMCCGFTFACYAGSYMRFPVVPLFARSLGADSLQVGMINSSFMLTAGVLSLPLGILSDRLGRKLLIICGLFIISLSSFLLCFSTSAVQMMAVYLFFGIGLAAFAPTMMSFVSDFSPATHLGRSYGWYTLAVYSGMSIGPAAGGAVAEWVGFQPVFFVSGMIPIAICGMVFFFLPRARHVLINRPPKRSTMDAARDLLHNIPLLSCWLATLAGCLGLGMFITFLPLHAQDQGVNVGQIGLIFGAQGLFNALSRIPFGRLSDRTERRSNLVVAGLICFAVSVAGLGLAYDVFTFTLCAAGVGMSMGSAFTAVGALIPTVVSPDSRGLAMGGYNSAIYIGMMLSSLGMGAVARDIGFQNGFLIVAAINILAAGLFFLVFNRSYHSSNVLAKTGQ